MNSTGERVAVGAYRQLDNAANASPYFTYTDYAWMPKNLKTVIITDQQYVLTGTFAGFTCIENLVYSFVKNSPD